MNCPTCNHWYRREVPAICTSCGHPVGSDVSITTNTTTEVVPLVVTVAPVGPTVNRMVQVPRRTERQ